MKTTETPKMVTLRATNHDMGAKDIERKVEQEHAERSALLKRQCGYRTVVIVDE